MTVWWALTLAGFLGGATYAGTWAALRAIARSDWLFGLLLRRDLRAIARAKRHNRTHGQARREGPRRDA
ncbi:hypothetical protein AVT46_gp58 [Mycobacterium phage MOOREtheMARYer]|uniref:Uncharacterized protein n=1 Tax=Mycobacterium phage MOOREtheMARYer TaxID=1647309 RepID=A0A0F6WEU3_9CAUD|nr:hypothetical protein AVT46_gp58 [Mycobacterium phage MOOREtheMARYer]AKF14919.1 hypothetical protein SEA_MOORETHEMARYER_58 [Mycobacterium phage MOOREtheMARYer]